jgi:hypothetical protein
MRTTLRFLAAAIAVFILVPASDAMAQRRRGLVDVSQPHERHGAWLSFGLGAGTDSYRYDVDSKFGHSLTKPSFFIAAGGTVNPHLRLGGEINAWVNEYTDASGYNITESLVGGLLTGQVYPVRDLGLFVKGGLGISRSGADVSGGGYGPGEVGFAYLYGAGYEVKLGRNFFITPLVSVMNHRSNQGNRSADPLGTLHERVVSFGVGLTFQPGR